MQLSRDYAVTRRITLKLLVYITLYSKSLNPTLHISPPSSVGSALGLKSKGSSPVWTTIFLPAMFACWHLGLYRWRSTVRILKRDESNRVYWFETGFLSLRNAACQQRTLTPLNTWSCPTLGLANVLMLRSLLNLSCLLTFEVRTSLGTCVCISLYVGCYYRKGPALIISLVIRFCLWTTTPPGLWP